ncbi:uncharacterized protein RP689-like [Oculina patagonica]
MALQNIQCCAVRRRGLVLKALLFLIVSIYIGVSFVDFAHYKGNKPWSSAPSCSETDEYRAILMDLAYKTHLILDSMKVEHWLMHGSLWGPLRGTPGVLPWDFDVDYGINGSSEIFNKLTLEEFKAKFTAVGMRVFDRFESSCSLVLKPNNSGANVDINFYYDYEGTMNKCGYEPWLFYINYRLYHTFPSRLVRPPLPKVTFGNFNVSVPKEGIEIMRYLYRFNWWKVVKPVGCE